MLILCMFESFFSFDKAQLTVLIELCVELGVIQSVIHHKSNLCKGRYSVCAKGGITNSTK